MSGARRSAGAAILLAVVLLLGLPRGAVAGSVDHGIALYRAGRLAAAEGAFRQAARLHPRDAEARHWLGITLYAQRRYREAAAVFEGAAVLRPRDPAIWLWLGHASAQSGDSARARAALQRVLLLATPRPLTEMAQMGLRSLSVPAATRSAGTPAAVAVHDPQTYAQIARFYNPRLSAGEAHSIGTAILGFGRQFNLDPRLTASLIAIESGFSPTARSHKGAMGLGQLMPATAASLGVVADDPVQNVYGTVRVLRGNLDRFGWNLTLALAAYNAGKAAVERYGGIPPYMETQLYVRSVGRLYLRMRQAYPAGPGEGLATRTGGQGQ